MKEISRVDCDTLGILAGRRLRLQLSMNESAERRVD